MNEPLLLLVMVVSPVRAGRELPKVSVPEAVMMMSPVWRLASVMQ